MLLTNTQFIILYLALQFDYPTLYTLNHQLSSWLCMGRLTLILLSVRYKCDFSTYYMLVINYMAEEVGFEPTRRYERPAGFQDQSLHPTWVLLHSGWFLTIYYRGQPP